MSTVPTQPTQPTQPTHYRTHDGLRLRLLSQGPQDAPTTVVLAHCWTSDLTSWGYQALDLRAEYGEGIRVLRYDHRGHGHSEVCTESTATIENLARDLSGIIDRCVPSGRIVLAGHSLGGMAVMALAEQRPDLFAERVDGVVLVSTSSGELSRVTLGLPLTLGNRARAQIPRVLAARSRLVSRRRRRRAPVVESAVTRLFLFGESSLRADRRAIVDGIINTPPESMCGFFTDLMLHDRFDGLHALAEVPVHVLVGERDVLTPPPHARRLVEALPHARLTVVPGAGHMLPLERDEIVTAALAESIVATREGIPLCRSGP